MNSVKVRPTGPRPSVEAAPSPLGTQLLAAGKITEQDIVRIVDHQRGSGARFGEVAVLFGILSQQEVMEALAKQYDYPCSSFEGSPLSPALIAARDPFGPIAEVFRSLRSHLLLRGFGESRECIMVASTRAGEGCSIVAANLAIVFAQLGQRTLLIDANFRNPALHLLFGLETTVGLSNVLSERCAFKDALLHVPPFRNLSILVAGATPPNPLELLSQLGFSYLLETLPSLFDIVIVDSPPILQFADARMIAARVKACILATQRNQTRTADLQNAKRELALSGAELIGAVLNC